MNRTFLPVRMLHSGETVNLYTEYGANEFLKQWETKGDFNFFSSELTKADVIRKKALKKGKISDADAARLYLIYEKLDCIIVQSDTAVFRERVPETEISAWLDHAADIFQAIAKDPRWIKNSTSKDTGFRHGNALIFAASCFLFKHPVPAAMVFENSAFFDGISALISSRNGFHLDPPVAHIIEFTISGIGCTCMENFDHPWEPEVVFKKLEASGVLEHYILCVAVKQPEGEVKQLLFFKFLLECATLVKKRFKAGTPCGDMLRKVLDGRMVVCPHALPYLQSLLKLSNRYEETDTRSSVGNAALCGNCGKLDEQHKLMQCARCRNTSYCSKECQRAHWKQHKLLCHQSSKQPPKHIGKTEKIVQDYPERHFVDILVRMAQESEKQGMLTMKEMVLEVDFNRDENGYIPILQDPPQFKVYSASSYLFQLQIKNAILKSEADVEGFAASQESCLSGDLFCYALMPRRLISGLKLRPIDSRTGAPLYSDENLEACRHALLDSNYDFLEKTLGDRSKEFEEKIERLRSMKQLSGDNN